MMSKNVIVGIISLKKFDERNSSCEIGYWLAEKYQNYGIMHQSCKLLIDYLFNNLNMKRIEIGISIENTTRGIQSDHNIVYNSGLSYFAVKP